MTPSEMPTNLLVIGSGAIGCEFASFYSDMGAKVTIVEMLDRILPVEDEEVSAFVQKQFEKQGMKILPKHGVEKIDIKPGRSVTATIKLPGLMSIFSTPCLGNIFMPCFSNCFWTKAETSSSSTGRMRSSISTIVTLAPMSE